MERREAVVKMSWMLKSALLTPTLVTVLQSCQDIVSKPIALQVLNADENETVIAMADTIIPRTNTPSASDVKVNYFMDLLLKDAFDEKTTQSFLKGLSQFNEDCKATTGSYFSELDEDDRFEYLKEVDADIMGKKYGEKVPFYYSFKHLAVTTYFSTEEGAIQNLDYNPVPGPYIGEVDCDENTKIMMGNHM
ncbi:gluconate 2-dehydrogenase subunit 3 family protein [Flagellimonas marina]|uniref:Gluconate 2-dehydrogenase subunit 3 family protein n=1 Tax=Flagellimonas marina TaxID=1775168 RepID=A0ABV8PQC9_9FLAO